MRAKMCYDCGGGEKCTRGRALCGDEHEKNTVLKF